MVENALIPVTTAVHPFNTTHPIALRHEGETVASIIETLCPKSFQSMAVVCLNGDILPVDQWDYATKQGDHLTLHVIPQGGNTGKDILRAVAMIAVIAVSVFVLGPAIGTALGYTAGSIGMSAVTAVTTAVATSVANLALNALIPPGPQGPNNSPYYQISGTSNQATPYGVVPRVYGRTLMVPPYGATVYTEYDNNQTVLHALFDLGYGPIKITNIQIGNTPIDDFTHIQYETREGRNTDAPLTLYTQKVNQQDFQVALINNGDTSTERTLPETINVGIDLVFPNGLFTLHRSDGSTGSYSVSFNVHIIDVVTGTHVVDQTLTFDQNSTNPVLQSYNWDVPASQYDVSITRETNAQAVAHGVDGAQWTALRCVTPFSGNLLPQNHAKLALRIRATEQLNGVLGQVNCIAQAYVQVWNGTTFTEQLNTHPAWAFLDVLTGSANNRAISTDLVDLAGLLNWATTYPSAEFNYIFQNRTTVWEALRLIASAGKAVPLLRDGTYGVAVDTTKDNPTQLFTPRNSNNFKMVRSYFDEVQGIEARFVAEAANWQQDSVFAYAPGFTADTVDGTKVSVINLYGVTTTAAAQDLAKYFLGVTLLRASNYTFDTDIEHIVASVGDRVEIQHDVINFGLISGRITSITRDMSNNIVSMEFDETLLGQPGVSYTALVRDQGGDILPISLIDTSSPTSVLVPASPYNDSAAPINVGDLVSVGSNTQLTLDAVVTKITPNADLSATIQVVDYAPSIFSGTLDLSIPTYVPTRSTGTAGISQPPASPIILSLISDETTAASTDGGPLSPRMHLVWTISGTGAQPSGFEVQYQVQGAVSYTPVGSLPADARDVYIPIPTAANTYNVRIRSVGVKGGVPSAWVTDLLSTGAHGGFLFTPDPPAAFTVAPGVMSCVITFTPSGDPRVSSSTVYISTTNDIATAYIAATPVTSPATIYGLQAGTTYYVWLKNVDYSLNYSTPTGPDTVVPLAVGTANISSDVNDLINNATDGVLKLNSALRALTTQQEDLSAAVFDVANTALTAARQLNDTVALAHQELTTTFRNGLFAESQARLILEAAVQGALGATTETVAAELVTIQSTVADLQAGKADASTVTALNAQINAPSTGLVSQIITLQDAVTTLDTSAASSAVSQLLVSAATGDALSDQDGEALLEAISAFQKGMQIANITLAFVQNSTSTQVVQNQSATAQAIGELGVSMQTAVATLMASIETEQNARVTADTASAQQISVLNASLAGYLGGTTVASAIANLNTIVALQGTTIAATSNSVTTLQSALSGYTTANAVSNAISALNTTVSSQGSSISANSSAITSINSALNGYTGANAVATAINSLNTTVTSQGSSITSISSSVTSLQSALSGYTGASAVATAFTSLNTTVTNQGNAINSISSSVTTLTTTVNGHTSSISTLTSSVNGIYTHWAVELDSNGTVIGYIHLDGSGATSAFTVNASNFSVYSGGSTTAAFSVSGGAAYLNVPLKVGAVSASSIIANDIIVNSHLAVNAVGTSNIIVGAVTNPVSTSYSTTVATGTGDGIGSWFEIGTLTGAFSGGTVQIDIMVNYDYFHPSVNKSVMFRLVRNGSTVVGTFPDVSPVYGYKMLVASSGVFGLTIDDPGGFTGDQTYSLQMQYLGSDPGYNTQMYGQLRATEILR